MPSKLHYDKASDFAFRINQLFKELCDFTDDEEDTASVDMPEDMEAKAYVAMLAEACIELERAAQRLGDVSACQGL